MALTLPYTLIASIVQSIVQIVIRLLNGHSMHQNIKLNLSLYYTSRASYSVSDFNPYFHGPHVLVTQPRRDSPPILLPLLHAPSRTVHTHTCITSQQTFAPLEVFPISDLP